MAYLWAKTGFFYLNKERKAKNNKTKNKRRV